MIIFKLPNSDLYNRKSAGLLSCVSSTIIKNINTNVLYFVNAGKERTVSYFAIINNMAIHLFEF